MEELIDSTMTKKYINILIFSSIWSYIIGTLAALYLNLVNYIIDFIWGYFNHNSHFSWRPIYPFLICIPLGIIIGFLIKKLGSYPLTIEEVLHEVRSTGKLNYHSWWKSLTLGLLSLGAGGSVGPEASTTVLASGMINWLGDKIRIMSTHYRAWTHFWQINVDKNILETSPKFNNLFKSKNHQKLFITFNILIGLLGMSVVFKLFPEEGAFGIHRRLIHWSWTILWYSLIPIVIGILFGYFFLYLEKVFTKVEMWHVPAIFKATLWGIILSFLTLITDYALFSGEFHIVPFSKTALSYSPLFLLLIALIKTFSTHAGFAMGWRGGKIFPAIFASVAVGGAIAQFIPIQPVITIALTVVSSITIVLNEPLLTAILLIFLLPISLAPLIFITAYIVMLIHKFLLKKIGLKSLIY